MSLSRYEDYVRRDGVLVRHPGVAPPVEREPTYFGAIPEGIMGTETWAQGFARISAAWNLNVVRYFSTNDAHPWTWPVATNMGGAYPLVVSMSGMSPTSVLNGSQDAGLQTMFTTMPTDRPMWYCYYHEPEDNINDGALTLKQWKDTTNYIGAMGKQYAPANAHHTTILIGDCFQPQGNWLGKTYEYYTDGLDWDVIDVLGADDYQRGQSYNDNPDGVVGTHARAAAALGVPWGIAEFGTQYARPDQDRADFLSGCIDIFDNSATRCEYVTYYESSRGKFGPWELMDPPNGFPFPLATQVWTDVCARMANVPMGS